MAYFNHAFQKCFLGNKGTQAANQGTAVGLDEGFILDSGIATVNLADTAAPYALGPGSFGFFGKDTWTSLAEGDLVSGECCPLVLASAALKLNDKQGPFHGGYQETNKSKYINPKLIREFYRVDQCTPQQNIVHIGNTNFTGASLGAVDSFDNATIVGGATYVDAINVPTTGGTGTGLTVDIVTTAGAVTAVSINNPGTGYTVADTITITGGDGAATIDVLTVTSAAGVSTDCIIPFYCGETYYLRLEIKGSPALRFANHNLYQTLQADGGCCSGTVPTEIDSTLIMIQWATAIVNNNFFESFIQPIVFDEAGVPWFHTAALAAADGWPVTQIWSNYVSTGHTAGQMAGIRLLGAYVDTSFGNCTFMITDHYEKEPIRILASLVDLTGDPCVFEGLCVIEECPPLQGMGFGEQVVRDLIMSESYLQNFFSTDLRIREITQGDDILNSVVRGNLYTRYYILHTVPRFNNPSGTFDNDQYMLEIITNAASTSFETFMSTWLGYCGDDCTSLVIRACTPCVPVAIPQP